MSHQASGASGGGGLARYIAAATLARTGDGGGVVAVVVLVTTSGAPGWLAGLLGACITAPHLLGPLPARPLDTARDGRKIIAVACVLHGATLALAVLSYPRFWTALTAALLIATGLTGPLLTGGISSRLPSIAGPSQQAQRRAQGWDVATYGFGGTIGPSLVALIAGWATPAVAGLVLAAGTAAAAVLVLLLPRTEPAAAPGEAPRPLQTLATLMRSGPLRRTLGLTMAVALCVAVLPVTAVASALSFGATAAAGGVLTAAYGTGNLLGSVLLMVRPLRGDADRLISILAAAVGIALAFAAASPTLTSAAATYALTGILNAAFFAATLAARSEFAPRAARGQVFVWVGALKITAGSAGTAAAGAVVGVAAHLPVVLAAAVALLSAAASVMDRRAASPEPSPEARGSRERIDL